MKKWFLTLLCVHGSFFLWAQGDLADPLHSLVPCQVSFLTTRFEETMAWYHEKLGFQVTERWEDDYSAQRTVRMELNGFGIEILESEAEDRPVASADFPDPTARGNALKPYQHIAFRVSDLAAALLALKAKGVEMLAGPVTEDDGAVRFCFIKDNNGNAIKLIQNGQRRLSLP